MSKHILILVFFCVSKSALVADFLEANAGSPETANICEQIAKALSQDRHVFKITEQKLSKKCPSCKACYESFVFNLKASDQEIFVLRDYCPQDGSTLFPVCNCEKSQTKDLRPGANWCPFCGNKIKSEVGLISIQDVAATRFCTKCDIEFDDPDFNFCHECRKSLRKCCVFEKDGSYCSICGNAKD